MVAFPLHPYVTNRFGLFWGIVLAVNGDYLVTGSNVVRFVARRDVRNGRAIQPEPRKAEGLQGNTGLDCVEELQLLCCGLTRGGKGLRLLHCSSTRGSACADE